MTMQIAAGSRNPEKPTLLFDNVFTKGTISGFGSTSANGQRENALGDNTFDFWDITELASTLVVDAGSAQMCNALGIAAHNIGTAGATIQVQSSGDAVTWATRLSVTPTDNSTIMGIFPDFSARYWRIRVTVGTPAIGVIKLGRRIIVPSGVSLGHIAVNHANRVELLSNDSIDGQFLNTRVIRKSGDTLLDFGLVPRSFIDTDMLEFEKAYNDGRTFFYAGSPVHLPKDVGYCKRPVGASEMRPSYEGGDLMQLEVEAQVYAG